MPVKIFLASALIILITMPSPCMCGDKSEYQIQHEKSLENKMKSQFSGTLISSEEFILDSEFRTGEFDVPYKGRSVQTQVIEYKILLADVVVYMQRRSDDSENPRFSRCHSKSKNCQKIHIDSQEKPEVFKTDLISFKLSEEISRDGVSCQMFALRIDERKTNIFFMCQSIEEPSHIMITHRVWESKSTVENLYGQFYLFLIATPTDLAIVDFNSFVKKRKNDLTFESISFPFPTKNDLANWHHKES